MDTQSSPELEARSNPDRAFFIYQRLVSLFLPVMACATYPMWIPQNRFPAVPWFEFLCPVPGFVDAALFGMILLLSLLLLVIGPQGRLRSHLWLAVAFALTFAFLLNQHRFQPWAYQFAVLSILFALTPPGIARRLATWLTLSVYFYSALSKLNPAFVNELGADFLSMLGSMVGLSLDPGTLGPWKWLALAFPAFEWLAFLLLINRPTRKVGVIAACLMHGGLLLILGPLGLNHSWGVLLWNLFFISQAILLFWFSPEEVPAFSGTWQQRVAQVVCAVVLLFPTLEVIGLGDAWPAWGLYASHVGRTHCFIVRHAVDSLPEDLQAYVDTDSTEDLFVPIELSRWSLETTGAPIYPGRRFAFAAGRSLVMKTDTANFMRFVVESPSGRFQDVRLTDAFSAEHLEQDSRKRFWLNTRPRDYFLSD